MFKKTLTVIGIFFSVVGILSGVSLLQDSGLAFAKSSRKIVFVNDGTIRKAIRTNARTVSELIEQNDFDLEPQDLIQPGLDEAISDGFYVNIFRSHPITIVDGNQITKIITPHRLKSEIIKNSGIKLYPEDEVESEVDNLSPNQDVGAKLIIKRAKLVEFDFYGVKSKVRTQAQTVGQFLADKKIKLTKEIKANSDLKTKVKTGSKIIVWFEGEQEEVKEEPIKFSTKRIYDYDLESGKKKVIQAGKDGRKIVTYKINIRNQKEVSRKEIKSVVIEKPVEQVEEIGMKVNLPAGSHQDWMRQAGISASDFGYVEFIISHESGWGHTKWNYGGSGAYGLCQALPARKMRTAGADYMTNPITQLKWCNGYAVGRYGSWANAYQFWTKHKWW